MRADTVLVAEQATRGAAVRDERPLIDGRWPNWTDLFRPREPLRCARRNRYRAIWISDLHLGTRGCKAEELLDFLRHHRADKLFLVGDIVDGWNLGPSWYWSPAQAAVCREIARWRRQGAHVVFLPGNHDESNAELVEGFFGRVEITANLLHRTADGRRMLVIHGHQFDGSLNLNRWMPMIGSQAYATVLKINEWYSREGGRSSKRSAVSGYLKLRLRRALEYLTDFADRAVYEAARDYKADGVICGHLHRAERRLIGDVLYVNDGDWVGSRSAIVERRDGTLRVIRWGGLRTIQPVAEAS
jgi:UDP-2,3-diacylglucosamine pyrophosphatase LpxH